MDYRMMKWYRFILFSHIKVILHKCHMQQLHAHPLKIRQNSKKILRTQNVFTLRFSLHFQAFLLCLVRSWDRLCWITVLLTANNISVSFLLAKHRFDDGGFLDSPVLTHVPVIICWVRKHAFWENIFLELKPQCGQCSWPPSQLLCFCAAEPSNQTAL